jgi:2'-5' RNA ligase
MDRSQLVIVALPPEHDEVRKVSSEKEPHLTLLYLGTPDYDAHQLDHIIDYVEHASSLLPAFYLDVEKRGELGDKKADVLFFNKKWSKEIATFRENLLQDPLIYSAYASAEQFEGWTPHLTLGYPDSPAKTGLSEYPLTHVRFNRIAVWTGESEGPVFPLDNPSYDMEVAMSDIKSPGAAMAELSHYGIKGMKWGVRRSDAQIAKAKSAPKPQMSTDAKTADRLRTKIQTKGTDSLSNQEMRQFLERMDLEQRYSRMMDVPQAKSKVERGHEQVKRYLKYAKTYDEVRKFMETDTGKKVKTGLKAAAAAGFAYATGGAGPAAAAGAGVIVRRVTE